MQFGVIWRDTKGKKSRLNALVYIATKSVKSTDRLLSELLEDYKQVDSLTDSTIMMPSTLQYICLEKEKHYLVSVFKDYFMVSEVERVSSYFYDGIFVKSEKGFKFPEIYQEVRGNEERIYEASLDINNLKKSK